MSAKIAFVAFFLLITGTLGQFANRYPVDFIFDNAPFMDYVKNQGFHRSIYDTKTDILQFAEGFLNGVGSASAFDEIRACIGDAGTVITDLSTGIEDIISKDSSRVLAGIKLIGQAAQVIPDAATACKAGEDEVKTLVKLVKSFQSPVQFLYYVGKSLIINHVDVLNEVSSAIDAYQAKNWNQLGFWVGKAMDTILLGNPEAVEDTKTDILQFAEGFLNGVGSASVFDEVRACIGDGETVITDLSTGIEDIISKDSSRVLAGIKLLGQAAQIIPDAATACKAGEDEVKTLVKLVKSFQSPIQFLYYVGKSLIINHVDVLNEVSNAIDAYQTKNWNQLGFWVGKAMDTILLGNPESVEDIKGDITAFAQGFLNGVATANVFQEIQSCFQDTETFTTDVIAAVGDIKSKDPARVKTGIMLLGQASQFIPAAATACKAADADVQNLIKLCKTFTSPESFLYYIGKSLLINHVEVINEVQNAVESYDSSNYNQLGFWVGKAMGTIILGQSSLVSDTKQEVLDFVEGLLEGIGSAQAFDQVRACVADSEDVISDIATAVADVESKDPSKVKDAIVLFGQVAQIVPDAVQECKAGYVDLKTLLKMVESFQNPMSFIYYIGKSLLVNHVEVINEITQAVTGYKEGNYTAVGYWVGAAMDTVLLGQDQVLNQEFADYLNKVAGWKAAVPSKFEGMTHREISSRFLGANLVDNTRFDNITVYDYEGAVNDVPANFNASEEWPGCIHPIRDQGQCGSCWAFAASEVLSDRLCIASNGSVNVVLSPQYLLSCNNILDHGCNGGTPLFSWWFIGTDGLVTDACLPYASYNGTQPIKCKDFTTCADGSPLKKYYGKSPASLNNPASIQANLMQYGPVEAAMTVYQDFMYYQGGIYTHTSGSELGGHAIKITGWGNENGTNYWIVANSWGPSWGENGFFRIAWGQCGIDSACVAGQADLSKSMTSENSFW